MVVVGASPQRDCTTRSPSIAEVSATLCMQDVLPMPMTYKTPGINSNFPKSCMQQR